MRQQLLKAGVTNIDAVLYTHDHADQSGGIDDLRVFALRKRERVKLKIFMQHLFLILQLLLLRADYFTIKHLKHLKSTKKNLQKK